MKTEHVNLISKFIDKKISMAIIMLVQASSSADLAFREFLALQENTHIDPQTKVMNGLAYARFFSEACGWYALAVARLRHDGSKEMKELLTRNLKHTKSLRELRVAVNHLYNEELIDAYRNDNYKIGKHQEKLAFNFSFMPNGPGFRIGTLEISMVSQLASMQKIESELSTL